MRARVRRSDAGFSLIEVLVAIVLFTALSTMLTGMVIQMLRTSSGVQSRLTNADQLRVAMDEVTKELRTAIRPEQLTSSCASACDAAFLPSTGSQVTFYANQGDAGKARLITLRVEENLPSKPGTGRLVEEEQASAVPGGIASAPACGTGCVKRTLARDLLWPVATSVFTYADSDCATFGAATDLTRISCVAVRLPVKGTRDNAGTSASSTVFLPNSVMGP